MIKEKILVESQQSIRYAMEIISENEKGICFIVKDGKLIGCLTDGDIRRSLIVNNNTARSVEEIMNKDFIALPCNASSETIRKTFSSKLKLIPLIDDNGKVIDFADAISNHRIPILQPDLAGNELKYVSDCIETNWISSQGKYVSEFESRFSDMHNGQHSLAVCNGTAALHLALLSLGIKEDDEVIVPDLTFAASINAVIFTGATPVLCEITKETFCLDLDEAEKLITNKTKAIMPVHLYGHPCNMDKVQKVADKYNLFIIEDCAEALGTRWKNQLVGTFGDAATFSFFGNKTISTGEGGMVLFKEKNPHTLCRQLRDHGMSPNKRYWHNMVGYNYRMTNLQAAIGVAQLEQFERILANKISISEWYKLCLKNYSDYFDLPYTDKDALHSNWLFTLILSKEINRDKIMSELMNHGIETRPIFNPMHSMPPYKDYPASQSLDVSKQISSQGLSLPTSSILTKADVQYICTSFLKVLSETRVM